MYSMMMIMQKILKKCTKNMIIKMAGLWIVLASIFLSRFSVMSLLLIL